MVKNNYGEIWATRDQILDPSPDSSMPDSSPTYLSFPLL